MDKYRKLLCVYLDCKYFNKLIDNKKCRQVVADVGDGLAVVRDL